jgi:hypothetical protein
VRYGIRVRAVRRHLKRGETVSSFLTSLQSAADALDRNIEIRMQPKSAS